MKYQDFSSDENVVSSEDTIFILHMWRYHGCHDNYSPRPSQKEKSITALAVGAYMINRILHARFWIRILSSRAQLEDKTRIHAGACNVLY